MLFTILCSKAALQTRVPYKLLSKQGKGDNGKENMGFSSKTIMEINLVSINRRIHSCWPTRGEQRESHDSHQGWVCQVLQDVARVRAPITQGDYTQLMLSQLLPWSSFLMWAVLITPVPRSSPSPVMLYKHAGSFSLRTHAQYNQTIRLNEDTFLCKWSWFTWSTTVGLLSSLHNLISFHWVFFTWKKIYLFFRL